MRNGSFSSGELARSAGVSAATVRHYERRRLLPPAERTPSGYRRYPAAALARMKVIRAALAVGFTIDELAGVLAERDRGAAPCRRVRAIAAERLRRLEDQATDLSRLCADLRSTIRAWDRRLRAAAPGRSAGLLDDLASRVDGAAVTLSPLIAPGLRRHMEKERRR
jgi:DNA-binding transcriptional MerR regulator